MKVGAIIAAAGAGRRMNAGRPKQFLALDGTSIVIHTLRKFDASALISYIVVVAPRESVDELAGLISGAGFRKSLVVVEGGGHRQDSVAIGLEHLEPDTALVAVHDAVRPFVSTAEIEAVVRQAERTGAAILAVPIVDTVKQVEKEVEKELVKSTLAREHLVLAQTPQAFRVEILREAFERARNDEYYGTDESSLVERLGIPVAIVRGSERNIKITRPTDLTLARAFLEEEKLGARSAMSEMKP